MHYHILQSIKSILLDTWDDRYFGSHLVVPRNRSWGIAPDQQRGTAGREVHEQTSARDVDTTLCRLSANHLSLAPHRLCAVHTVGTQAGFTDTSNCN